MQESLLQNPNAEQQPQQPQETQATPEEQAQFDAYFKAALGEVMGNPQAFERMMKALEAAKSNPIDGVARIALALYDKAEQKVGPIDDDDMTEALGEAIIEALLDMAEEGGIIENVDAELANAIYVKLAQMWIQANPERADPEDVQYIQSNQGQAQGGAV